MTQDTLDLTAAVKAGDLDSVRDWLAEHGALDIAEELPRSPRTDQAVLFRILPKDRARAVFEALDPVDQHGLIEALADHSVHDLFLHIDADDRARLLDEVPATVAKRLLANLPADARETTNRLLGYPEESVGRTMSPRFVSVRAGHPAADALAKVRRAGLRPREVLVVPVTDDQRKLLGVVDLPDLVTAEPGTTVGELIRTETYAVQVDEDREVGARLVQEADLVARPALILAAVATVDVLEAFEDTLEAVVALALFIPLLIDTCGNSGSQAATVVIRAMAIGEVTIRDLPRILHRELRVGRLLGVRLGVVGFPIVWFFYGADFAIVVSATLLVICTWASFAGACSPSSRSG